MGAPSSILLVYVTEAATGISAKAAKLEDGFRRAGLSVESYYFHGAASRREKLRSWLRVTVAAVTGCARRKHDVVFVRYAYYFAPIYLVGGLLGANLHIEVNSDAQAELLSRRRWFKAAADRLAFAIAARAARRIHAVSQDLARRIRASAPNAEVVFTPNFVVDEYFVPEARTPLGDRAVRVLFLGNTAQPWHGVERFLRIVADSDQFRASCELHFVGNVSDVTRQVIEELRLTPVVVVHGFQAGSAKQRLVSSMDVGISGFALDSIGLTETTGIKVGEYLYAGLPVVLGYRDPALPAVAPFALSIDLRGDPRDAQADFVSFVEAAKGNADLSRAAHAYASASLSVDKYVQNVLA